MDLAIETSVPYIQNGVVSNGQSIQDSVVDPDSASTQDSPVDKNSENLHPENKVKTLETEHPDSNKEVKANGEGSEWSNGPTTKEVNGSGWISVDESPVVLPAATETPWVAPKRHTFYLIRIPRSVDEKLRNEIRLAEAKLEQAIKKRDSHKVAMQESKNKKFALLDKLKPLREKERACWAALQGKRTEMEPFSMALNKFRSAQGNANSNARGKGQDICSSEEELNERIGDIEYRIQHESISLKEEKQLLREIKQLESTRSQVCANSALQQELTESLGQKEDIQDQYKFLCQDMDGIRKEHSLASADCQAIDKEINLLNAAIEEFRQLYDKANVVQQDAFTALKELKKQESSKNDPFFQNKRDIQTAKELALQRKPEDVEQFCLKNVNEFMHIWNNNAKFRAEYIKNNERSTVRRLETLDGRSLGPGEKLPQIADPDLIVPNSVSVKQATEPSSTKPSQVTVPKPPNETPVQKPAPLPTTAPVSKSTRAPKVDLDVKQEAFHVTEEPVVVKSRQIEPDTRIEEDVDNEIDALELKEALRQEQIAKAKEAEERKKRRAEKSEQKAQLRAKKEAERKLKKKAQKAAGAVAGDDAAAEAKKDTPSTTDSQESSVNEPPSVEVATASNNRAQKGSVVGRRKISSREVKGSRPPFPPRAAKKSAFPLPLWACIVAGILVLLFAIFLFLRM